MAQKPDFMKAVKAVGHQMDQTSNRQDSQRTVNKPRQPASAPQGSEPDAGKNVSGSTSTSRTSATIYMDRDLNRRLKVLAALEGRKLNDYFLEAVEDYVAKIGDRLPKL